MITILNKIKSDGITFGFYILSLVVVAGAVFILSALFLPGKVYRPKASALPAIGEPFRIGFLEITVHDIRYDEVGDQNFWLPPDTHFVIADITFANISTHSAEFVPLLHIHARDSLGRVYPVEPIPTKYGQWSGSLLGGDAVRQEIGFIIPKIATKIRLYFETGTPGRETGILILP